MNIYPYKDEKGRKKWRFDKRVSGQRLQAKGFRTRKEAEETLRERLGTVQKINTDFLKLCHEYLNFSEIKYRPTTYDSKKRAIRRLLAFYGQTAGPTPLDVSRYLQYRAKETSGCTSNIERKDLHAMFEWGKKHNIAGSNPVRLVEEMPYDQPKKYVPPIEDINAILLVAGSYRDMLDCFLYSVARKSEIFGLTWEDIDFEDRIVRLWTRKRRGGNLEARYIPISRPLEAILKRLHASKHKGVSYLFTSPRTGTRFAHLCSVMPRLCAKAGVKPFGFHAFRHYGPSYLKRKNVDTKTIQTLLGHKSLRTTEIYLHSLPESVRDGAEVLGEIGVGSNLGSNKHAKHAKYTTHATTAKMGASEKP